MPTRLLDDAMSRRRVKRMLNAQLSRGRQKRLLEVLQRRKLDAAVVGWPGHVYYLSAHQPGWLHQSCLILLADGRSWLVTANQPNTAAAADEVVAYEANWMGTQRSDQPAVVAEKVIEALKVRGVRRIGMDVSQTTAAVALRFEGEATSIDDDLLQHRRAKDADELELMKTAVRCTVAMYRRAKEMIGPGVKELRVFAELQAIAVAEAGEPLYPMHLGNDYACGVLGGPPRKDRRAKAGEIYILDLGPAYRGYFSDNARSIAVDRRPTDEQMNAWEAVVGVFPIVERMAKPGVRCRDIFAAVDEHLKQKRGGGMPHHLGHGVGLQPHEFPHLNPKWDDVLIEGEVFTAEPGQYGPELAGGMRIENQYLVTKDGVRNLVDFPLELA